MEPSVTRSCMHISGWNAAAMTTAARRSVAEIPHAAYLKVFLIVNAHSRGRDGCAQMNGPGFNFIT